MKDGPMSNFTVSNKTLPVWSGGPAATCSICKFTNEYPWYIIFNSVFGELTYQVSTGDHVAEQNIHLCSDHATELKGILDEILPDDRLAGAKAKLFQAEAARARAEKRADKAEAALAAMQDWITEVPAK